MKFHLLRWKHILKLKNLDWPYVYSLWNEFFSYCWKTISKWMLCLLFLDEEVYAVGDFPHLLLPKGPHHPGSGEMCVASRTKSSKSHLHGKQNISKDSDQIRSVTQSCPTLCNPMNHSMPGLLLQSQTPGVHWDVHWVSDAIQPSHSLSSPSLAPNPSQHQSLFQWVNSSHEVAKVLEFQL